MRMFVILMGRFKQYTWVRLRTIMSQQKLFNVGSGESAVLLYLNNGSFEGSEKFPDEAVICQVLVKARSGLGLMVYAEQLDLRKEETE